MSIFPEPGCPCFLANFSLAVQLTENAESNCLKQQISKKVNLYTDWEPAHPRDCTAKSFWLCLGGIEGNECKASVGARLYCCFESSKYHRSITLLMLLEFNITQKSALGNC